MVFPVAPPDGTRHVKGGDRYTYQAADNAWRRWDTGSINLSGAGSPMDGVTDDGPLLQAFIDAKYAAGFRVFVFDPGVPWLITTMLDFVQAEDVTFIAYGATVTHGGTQGVDDQAMFKFVQCGRVTFKGGRWVGRRGPSPASFADDGERWIFYRSASYALTVVDADLDNWGGAAISSGWENVLFADFSPAGPGLGQTILRSIRANNVVVICNTIGGGTSQFIMSDCHASNGQGLCKVDGQQERGPEQSGQHGDYGTMRSYTINGCTAKDMVAGGATALAVVSYQEDIGTASINGLVADGVTDMAVVSIDRAQTDQPAGEVTINGLVATNVSYLVAGLNTAIVNRGGTDVYIDGMYLNGCGVYTTDDNFATQQGITTVTGGALIGGIANAFQGAIRLNGVRLERAAEPSNAPLRLNGGGVIETTNCWFDPAWPQHSSGGDAANHVRGPGDWHGSTVRGTTAERPALTAKDEGATFWDEDTNSPLWWDGTAWMSINEASTGTGTFTGDGTTAQFDLVHNLGKGAVAVALHNTTTNEVNPPGGPGITYVDDNTTRLTYATAPTAGHVYNWSAT